MNADKNGLVIEDLSVTIDTSQILKSVSWRVNKGETLGLVGESGSGKSMSILAIAGLLPERAKASGSVRLSGRELLGASEAVLCDIRGARIGIVFQEPLTALNPLQSIGQQVAETVRIHQGLSRKDALKRAAKTLKRVGLDPKEIPLTRYPHELSGGQRQRVAIAIAVILKPDVILADEPTTALDVTTQAEVLALLSKLAKEDGCALVMVTHDLPLLDGFADKIAVMKDGEIVEEIVGPLAEKSLKEDYSRALFTAALYKDVKRKPARERAVLEVQNLSCEYARKSGFFQKRSPFQAVKDVSFRLKAGETLALVGESGSGKSTLGKAILGLNPIRKGRVKLLGKPFLGEGVNLDPEQIRAYRQKIQMVFQDPKGSFNPRHKAGRIIGEPYWLLNSKLDKAQKEERVGELLTAVGLKASDKDKYPYEFSGGQRQRIAIARALATNPDVIVLDEAVSALDVTIRAQILEVLVDLRRKMGLSYLFISHDMSVVRGFAHRVMVMRAGEIVEIGQTKDIFTHPAHPYTRALIAATPQLVRG